MKKMLSLVALGLSLSLGTAYAAEEKTAQQGKMATCNADAKTKELKGDERKKFMKECLSAKSAAPAADAAPASAQQGKMKACNADAKTKELKGDERKKFMKECLSAK
ncbi:MAG: PsiF family protein [Rhodoferax sp.]|nr:PsiF family protein [Rhodoferax sp.]